MTEDGRQIIAEATEEWRRLNTGSNRGGTAPASEFPPSEFVTAFAFSRQLRLSDELDARSSEAQGLHRATASRSADRTRAAPVFRFARRLTVLLRGARHPKGFMHWPPAARRQRR